MARTKRDIKYSNPNARRIRHRSERVNQQEYIQQMKEAGYQSLVRPRDKESIQNPWDDHPVSGWAETYKPTVHPSKVYEYVRD